MSGKSLRKVKEFSVSSLLATLFVLIEANKTNVMIIKSLPSHKYKSFAGKISHTETSVKKKRNLYK